MAFDLHAADATRAQIIFNWFPSGPQNSAERSIKDYITRLLDDAMNDGRLNYEAHQEEQTVYTPSYDPPYSTTSLITVKRIKRSDLIEFLALHDKNPPEGSVLFEWFKLEKPKPSAPKQDADQITQPTFNLSSTDNAKQNTQQLEIKNSQPSLQTIEDPDRKRKSRLPDRLSSLTKFIDYLVAAGNKQRQKWPDTTPKIDVHALPCAKDKLLTIIQYWEEYIAKTPHKDRVWNGISRMPEDVWASTERKAICNVVQSSKQYDENFFAQINNDFRSIK